MAKKVFTDESLKTFVNEIKGYIDSNSSSTDGVVVNVEIGNWVAQSNGTYTNTITVSEVTSNDIYDVSLYGDFTEEQAHAYDFLVSSIDTMNGKIVLTASEKINVAFSIILRGKVNLEDKNVYVSDLSATSIEYDNSKSNLDATDAQNAIDELATAISGLVISVTTGSWDLQVDGTYKKIIPVEQITGKETLDVCLYPGDVHTNEQIVAFSELITSIETGEGRITLTAVEEITVSFRIFLYGKINFDKNNLVALDGSIMEVKEVTQEYYDNLPQAEKENGIYVTDGDDELSAKNIEYDGRKTGLGTNIQDAIDKLAINGVGSGGSGNTIIGSANLEWELLGTTTGATPLSYDLTDYSEILVVPVWNDIIHSTRIIPKVAISSEESRFTINGYYAKSTGNCYIGAMISLTSLTLYECIINTNDVTSECVTKVYGLKTTAGSSGGSILYSGEEREMLWQNPSMDSLVHNTAFPGQSISIPNLTSYKAIEVLVFALITTAGAVFPETTRIDSFLYNKAMALNHGHDTSLYLRDVAITENEITFGDGYQGDSKANHRMIPIAIFGIKESGGSNLVNAIQWYIDNGYLPDYNTPYKYMYNRGNMCSSLTGGWEQGYTSNSGAGSVVLNTDNIMISTNSTSGEGNYIGITSKEMIDLTNINKLNVKLDLNTPTDTSHAYLYITKTKNGARDTAETIINLSNGTSLATLETHDITGNYYIAFVIRGYAATSNATVYEIYGE